MDIPFSINPLFLVSDNYAIAQNALNGAAVPTALTDDIEGETRDAAMPDIGADEFDLPMTDAGVEAILSPTVPFAAGSQNVMASIKNFGSDALTSLTLNWSHNGTGQTAVNWTGSLATGDTAQVQLGSLTLPIKQSHDIAVWSSNPNGGTDLVSVNDTASVSALYAALSGVYTLGGASPDFTDFAEAAAQLNEGGVTDDVFFDVRDGTYNEQVVLEEVVGAGENSSVTFRSESGDSSAVVLTFSASSSDNYTLRLGGADWVRVEKMTLEATNASYARVLELQNGADNNRFENCVFRGYPTTSTSGNLAVIYSQPSIVNDENNVFQNNYILHGSYGLYLRGYSPTNLESGYQIEDNHIDSCYYQGIYMIYQNAPKIRSNLVNAASTYSGSQGIVLYYCDNGLEVLKNRVLGFQGKGVHLQYADATADEPMLIANNFVQLSSSNTGYGIYAYEGAYQKFYHNNVHINNTSPNSCAFRTRTGNNKQVVNNIFANTGGGYAIYQEGTTGMTQSDHNDLYTTGANLGFWSSNQPTLASWTAASGFDPNSVSVDPMFTSSADLHIGNTTLDKAGTSIAEVTDDIDGENRSPVQPDIGADEIATDALDAVMVSIDTPAKPFVAGTQNVLVSLQNNGLGTLTSADINWEVNGIAQTVFNWTGSLATGEKEDSVNIGNFNFTPNTSYTITALVDSPNTGTDDEPANDTASVSNLYPALAGTYTIGGATPDFLNFTEATAALSNGGVTAAVIFEVRNGTYNEQVSIPEITGASAANTTTFRSESGDSSTVVISLSASSTDNYTLRLAGADWIRVEKMTLEATHTTYGRVVDLQQGANHNRFENCEFRGITTTSTSTNGAVIYSSYSGQNDDYNLFQNNWIRNGSYGFYFNGTGATNLEIGNIIQNNRVENSYYTGISANSQDAVKIIGNVLLTNSVYSNSYGISVSSCDNQTEILKNNITGFANGIRINDSEGTQDDKILVANNFVSIEGTSSQNGIYSYKGSRQNFFHNTVRVFNTNANSAAFYTQEGNNKVLYNNILVNEGGGYAMYRWSTNGIVQSDNNSLHTNGTYLGYWFGTQTATLADWQNVSNLDANSTELDPLFSTPDSYPVAQISFKDAGTDLADIAADIEGEARNVLLPDIGCDEFPLPQDDAGISDILPPSVPFADGSQPLSVNLKNYGSADLLSAVIHWTVNGTAQTDVNWTGTVPSGGTETVLLGNVTYAVNQVYGIVSWTSLPNGMADAVAVNDSSSMSNIYAGLSGPYTLGGSSPDFADFAEAATNLNIGGVVGAVVFDVRDGTYNEQVILNETPGVDTTNTVTFQSETGDSSAVVLTFGSTTSADNYTLDLDGADWLVFKKMTLQATGTAYGKAVVLQNGADHNRFENCGIRGVPTTSTSSNLTVVYSPGNGTTDNYNTFLNNYIVHGSIGLYLFGNNEPDPEIGWLLEGNHIDSSYYWGIYLAYCSGSNVRSNLISTASATSSSGIRMGGWNKGEIVGNQILGFQYRGISINYSNSSTTRELLIANNFIQVPGTSTGHGIYTNYGANEKYYHNTVHITNTNANSSAFYTWQGNNKLLRNNIFANTGGGYAFYRRDNAGVTISDFNDLYTTGAAIGYWNGYQATLADWTAASSLDGNSVSVDPLFLSLDSFQIAQASLNNAGTPTPLIPLDIEGETRNTQTPDIGCDEFSPPADDAGISAIAPNVPFAEGQYPMPVILKNFGSDTLLSATLNWKVNGNLQAPVAWTGSLPPNDTLQVELDSFEFFINQAYEVAAWTSLPNGIADIVGANDSSTMQNVYAGLNGTYTLGGSSPDFADFAAASANLNFGGVVGTTTFNVRNGTYNEQVVLNEIPGADTLMTAVFQSETGDSSAVVLTFGSTTSADNYTLDLDGADWLVFKKLTLQATGSTYAKVVVLQNGADHNRFENCGIRGVPTTSTSSNLTVVYSPGNGTTDNYNTFLNNYIVHGSIGLYLFGNNEPDPEIGWLLEGNHIDSSYYWGIYLAYCSGSNVRSNLISTASATSSSGIRMGGWNKGEIVGNQILGFQYRGISINYSNSSTTRELLIANNFIQVPGTSTGHGIYTNYGANEKYYHNTVHITNTNANSSAFYTWQGNNKLLRNNIFANTGGGYAFYRRDNAGVTISDFNDLYTTGAAIGYWNGYQATLADWTAASSLDGNSVSVDPLFVGGTDLHVTSIALNNAGTPVPEVTDDIDGEVRDLTTPDIGADEFPIAQHDAAMISIDSPTMPFVADIQPIFVTILNNGADTLTSLDIEWEVNGIPQPTYQLLDSLPSAQTRDSINIGNFLFEVDTAYNISVWAKNPNGMADEDPQNDTVIVENLYAALGGIYTIGGTNPDFQTFTAAVNALKNGGVVDSVIFNVRDGVYNEQITIPAITNISVDKSITFQSESGDSTAVKITFSANNTNNYTLQLDGADWLRFKKLSFEATNSSYARVVDIRNGADNNRFENNRLLGFPTTTSSSNLAIIYSTGTVDHFNVFRKNHFMNGSEGLRYFDQVQYQYENGTEVEFNIFENQYYRGIYVESQNGVKIHGNTIVSNSGYSGYRGIDANSCINETEITKNTINAAQGSYGILVQNAQGSLNQEGLTANNFVAFGGTYLNAAIYVGNSSWQNFYHNNVNVTATNTGSRAFQVYYGSNIEVLNNVFANAQTGYAYYSNSTTAVTSSDHNDLFTNGSNIGYWIGSDALALSNWQALSGKDANSISVDPQYESPTDLHVTEVGLNNAATPLAAVTDDLDSEARDLLTPDIGADEFTPVSTNDAGITGIPFPNKTTPFSAGNQTVTTLIRNNGSDTLTTANIHWEINEMAQTTYNWTGFLLPGSTDTVNVGNFSFSINEGYDLQVYTSLPNGNPDSLNHNDTSLVTGLYAGLAGIYTIGGVFPDFLDFSDAANILNLGGMLAAVEFDVRNGTYDDQFCLSPIRGSSATNTLLFQSESGNRNLVTLTNSSTSQDYTVQLNGADYVTFQNMTLEAGNANAATVVEIRNGSDNLTFLNNRITATAFSGDDLVASESNSQDNNLVFQNNLFEGGRYAIELEGENTGKLESGILIENNTFSGQRDGAIYMVYMDAPKIRSNIISGEGSGAGYYGLFCRFCDNELEVANNKITMSGDFGIYFDRCDATSLDRGLTLNNFIHVNSGNISSGIYLSNCIFQNIHFNNIHVTSTNVGSRAFYIASGGNNSLLNNVLANSNLGYALYTTTNNAIAGSNFNGLYSTGSNLAYWAGSDASDLAALQALNGQDGNSVETNPLFYSEMDLHILQVALDSAGTLTPGITTDIDGDTRTTPPDIGADEFDFLTDDVGMIGLVSPEDGCDIGSMATVTVAIQNFGGLPQTGFDVSLQLNGGAVVTENVGAVIVQPGDTTHFTFTATVDISFFTMHTFELSTQMSGDLNSGNDMLTATVENHQMPSQPANMLPEDGATDLDPPLNLSWFPAFGASRYDLFFWEDTTSMPTVPIAQDLTQISYIYNSGNLVFGETYNWQVLAKNDYCETPGVVQSLTLRELPDLIVNNVTAPASPFSGQQIQVSWEIDNMGTGSTNATPWIDAIFLSADTNLNVGADFYLGGIANLTALNPGQMYAQTATVTIPNGLAGTYYIFVLSDGFDAIEEGSNNNNSAVTTALSISLTPPPDLQVTSIITPNNTFSNQIIDVSWAVTNTGIGDVPPDNNFTDYIYLSDEDFFNPSNVTLLATQLRTPLMAGESDTLTKSVQLPQGIFGGYYIHIVTDFSNQVFEFVFEDNNIGTSDTLNVILQPPPDLVVTDIVTPDSVSNLENVSLTWTVLNQGGASATGSWQDRVYISSQPTFSAGSATNIGTFVKSGDVEQDSAYTRTKTVNIPQNRTGINYFHVETDVFDELYEYVYEGNNVGNSDTTIIKNADLIATSVTAVDTANSGENLALQWTVKNVGIGKLLNSTRTDNIFISPNSVYDPLTAIALGTSTYNQNLQPGENLIRQATVTIPNGIAATYYLHVFTDFGDNVFENQHENNNTNQTSIEILLSPWPDLQVTTISGLPDTTLAGTLLSLNYEVGNFGTADVQSAGWNDQVYISPNPAWNPADAVLLKNLNVLGAVNVGANYSGSTDFIIPMLGNNAPSGICYIYLVADGDDDIFEHTDENNNVLRSNPIVVFAPDPVDFEITNATSLPDSLMSGDQVNLQWMVKNLGSSTALWDYGLWYDGVFLSTDPVWDYNDLLVKDFTQSGPVEEQEKYADNQFFDIPHDALGDYYIFLVADHLDLTSDGNGTNNIRQIFPASNSDGSGPLQTIHIEISPSPDLQVNSFTAPANAATGQPIELTWKVTNTGIGDTQSSWTDKVYLSTNFDIDQNDVIIATKSQSHNLANAEFYEDTIQVNLPANVSGNFVLIFKTDANNSLFEFNGETNNKFLSYLTITQPLPTDLVVSDLSANSMAIVGDPYTIDYTLKNEGNNPATGSLQELLYFSADSVFDASDIRFTNPIPRIINLAPQGTLANSVVNTVPGLPLGEYFLIAQTDILDNIFENNDTNNVRISTQKVMVTVQELPLGIPTTDTLNTNQNLYYRIEIPDSLEGETMLLTLDAVPTNSVNELYLSFGDMPTRSDHDFSFGQAFSADQEIVVPALAKGTYYLLAYGSHPSSGSEQEIELEAQILQFSIREILANRGGNSGNVTVKMEGADFTADMTVRLEDATLGTIIADNLTFLNSAEVFVTFPLGGTLIGTYDVVAEKTVSDTTQLADGFEVISSDAGTTAGGGSGSGFFCKIVNVGTDQNLSSNLAYPVSVRVNRLVPITIEYGNSGSVDIPCPTRTIFSLRGAPLSFVPNEFSGNKQKLYLEFEEQGGPPGILRPGSASTITVYSYSSHALRFIIKR